ncbi:hypothetical protein EK21DRAFT_96238 [Setomelanomma holmii]|uniref:Uncharacterized protein n=1 Tax=Setomelanomma holmii TaxID=210430 RepID=A0A9P4HJE2_9PLEO|nr:hypothetical protein EK21DRAFT_96238 [Setomelanomma holmii]
MHSLRGWKWMVLGGLVGRAAAVPKPIITPAPEVGVEAWVKRQGPDAVSFAQLLLTAIPLSLREIAATNAPAVSSILWEEFLDDKKPQWFLDLPWDIQSYLIVEFGPETAWPTAPPQTTGVDATPTQSSWQWPSSTNIPQSSQATPSASVSAPSSALQSSLSSRATFSTSTRSSSGSSISSGIVSRSGSSASATTTAEAVSPPESNAGLTRHQKIGLGVAILLACCFLCRRRRNKRHVNGAEPPSSPGFIPRFAFQDKSTNHFDHRAPLNPTLNNSNGDLGTMNWEDDGYDPYESTAYNAPPMAASHRPNASSPASDPPMTMQDSQPIMAPVVFHTHSSNRARGKRTSYSSLSSVAEVSEPDSPMESPILGRQTTPLQRKRRPSLPMVLEMPTAPRTATIKRKPVPQSPTGISPAAEAASQSLLRPTMTHVDHSGSSSSGLALSTNSSHSNYGAGYQTDMTSPISPISQHAPTNPFSNDYSYVEDYGPEYRDGYLDHEDGAYGGNRSLDRYPDPSPPRRSSLKTEWPLRNLSMGKRNRSPMWDRVYES